MQAKFLAFIAVLLFMECSGYILRKSIVFSNIQSKQQNYVNDSPKSSVNMLALSVGPVAKGILAVPAMYTLMSINEYITHRYYQHLDFNKQTNLKKIISILTFNKDSEKIKLKSSGHIEHHAETLDDMSLRIDDKWLAAAPSKMLNADAYRGTSFSWTAVGLMTLQMLPSTIPVFHILGFSFKSTIALLLPAMLLHTLIWNALHPGISQLYVLSMTYISFLIANYIRYAQFT